MHEPFFQSSVHSKEQIQGLGEVSSVHMCDPTVPTEDCEALDWLAIKFDWWGERGGVPWSARSEVGKKEGECGDSVSTTPWKSIHAAQSNLPGCSAGTHQRISLETYLRYSTSRAPLQLSLGSA